MSLSFHSDKTIGLLLIIGSVLLFIPYALLTSVFDYPGILRAEAGVILTRFAQGGHSLIWTWWAFAMVGLPLLQAYILIGQKLENTVPYVRWATTLGVISLIAQMIGLLRWTFVVPMLADMYVHAQTEATREAVTIAFRVVHQYGGVVLGEHVGQLFTIVWTIMINSAFRELRIFPQWVNGLGYAAAALYLTAQAELVATVMPGFPVWEWGGLVGSTLWLIWLITIGILFLRRSNATKLSTTFLVTKE